MLKICRYLYFHRFAFFEGRSATQNILMME